MRQLATIRRIAAIEPIEGADKIEVAKIDGWNVVIGKDANHKVGDLIVFYEIDAMLPISPEYEFLRRNCYVKNSLNGDGFRIKTIRLRKQISQGLIMPLSAQSDDRSEGAIQGPTEGTYTPFLLVKEGDDVTEWLGVKKFERIIPANLAGKAKGNFPSFIPKTDAERIQNCYRTFERDWKEHLFEITVKLDGTSATYYHNDGVFGVCSRNLDLLEDENNLYWRVAKKYKIEEFLRSLPFNAALQGEICGPRVQKNQEQLSEEMLFTFNIWNIDERRYLNSHERHKTINENLIIAPHVNFMFGKDFGSLQEILDYASGPSYNPNVKREGIVFKSVNDPSISFKAISNEWLLENGE